MSDEEKLSRYERDKFLFKLDKEFAFAGAKIPAEIMVDGERIELRAFVFGMSKKRGTLTREEMAEVGRVVALLRRKRRETVSRISREEITAAEAKALYETTTGLDRALDTLYNAPLPRPSIAEESRKARLEDGRRWMNLVKRVYTGEDKRRRDRE